MDKQAFLNELRALNVENQSTAELYEAISHLAIKWGGVPSPKEKRNAYYLSMEFLVGRWFYNNLLELGVLKEVEEILAQKGKSVSDFEEIDDAALGNGGLGRLAACFLDSAAGLGLPLYGYGIRYQFGLFKQAIKDGEQVELPDDWQRFGDPWSERREEEKREIRFADFTATAVPYDYPVLGKRTNTLRLFQAEGSKEAEQISAYLYPADEEESGKLLRLRQEYFFSAAAMGELVDEFVKAHGERFNDFPKEHAVQLNDTHPVIAIAEFIRLLTERGVSFSKALSLAKKTFCYTNHTVLPEALEKWSEGLIKKILPEIARIIQKISQAQRREWKRLSIPQEEQAELAISSQGVISMANLAVYVCRSVNGVAGIHTQILKEGLFRAAYRRFPQKFNNKTNGITHRRWLFLSNPELCALLDRAIGEDWRGEIERLSRLMGNEEEIAREFIDVKQEKKRQLFAYIKRREGVTLPENAIVYAQVKRLHEYKRQLSTALAIWAIYGQIKRGEVAFYPSVFLFGAKSAPAYKRAKSIIKLIHKIARIIDADEEVNGLLKVIFVTDYNVSYAEKIVAGTDVSLQVSTAGTEASGTGNMKFMMNGAVTCGTLDGANVEIAELAGRQNNFIFGATVEEIERLKRAGYDGREALLNDEVRRTVEALVDGTLGEAGGEFAELYESLTKGASWHAPDHYFVLHDLPAYLKTLIEINCDYAENRREFAVKQLKNIASSAYFSSDRTIREYAEEIWWI